MANDSELHCSLQELYLLGKYEFEQDNLAIYISRGYPAFDGGVLV